MAEQIVTHMPSANFSIGIDVGGTNMRAARISPQGKILERTSISGSRDPERAVALIKELAVQMNVSEAAAIGVGIPGRVDGRTGEIISGGYLDLSGIDLKADLAANFSRPVVVANDCSMALVGEARCGAAKGFRNSVMMTIGTGIGGAVMQDGKIVTGKRCAGQLGHLVVNFGGQPCLCGQRGCIETESSGTSLRRHLDAAGFGSDIRFENVFALAREKEPAALQVMIAWAEPLRCAIHTLSATFDPDIVLLGGGMGEAAIQALGFLPDMTTWYETNVRLALLGDDAGVIGSGLAAFDLLKGPQLSGRRLVMVNGVPASGKSSVAHALASKTGWPLLALDTIKNPFLEVLEGVDRTMNRALGRASYKAIFAAIKESAPGSTFIVDAWFGFQPPELLRELIDMAGVTQVAELWCHAPPEIIAERYIQRAGVRLPGHPGADYAVELLELAKIARPSAFGPVLNVETQRPFDLGEAHDWIERALRQSQDPEAATERV